METELLTPAEIAVRMNTTRINVIRKCQRGQLPYVKIGPRKIMIPRAAWDQWIAEKTAEALANVKAS